MKKRNSLLAILTISLVINPIIPMHGQSMFDLESGYVSTGYNDIRIP